MFCCALLPIHAASSAAPRTAIQSASSAAIQPVISAAPASSQRTISLPPVESVRETPVLGTPQSNTIQDNAANAVGILLWAACIGGITAIVRAARRTRRRHAPPDARGRRRYRAVRRDRKHRLLGDKYYHDSKYHRKL